MECQSRRCDFRPCRRSLDLIPSLPPLLRPPQIPAAALEETPHEILIPPNAAQPSTDQQVPSAEASKPPQDSLQRTDDH